MSSSSDANHEPFSLLKRTTTKTQGGRKVYRYYVRFWDPRTKEYQTARSTGQTSKAAAHAWAMEELEKEQFRRMTNWEELTQGMFEPDSAFLKFYRPLKKSFGEVHRLHCKNYLREYIVPLIGKKVVRQTTAKDLQTLQAQLLERPVVTKTKAVVGARQEADRKKAVILGRKPVVKTLSSSTVQKVMSVVRLMVLWAGQKGELKADPFVGFKPVSLKKRRRGQLTSEEIVRLFQLGTEAWPDKRLRVFCLVAAVSGLRSGELQGLIRSSVVEIQDAQGRPAGMLKVLYNWTQRGELKGTKSDKDRYSAVPWDVYTELKDLMDTSPYKEPGDFVFYQADRNVPVSHQMIHEHFVRAIHALGINEDERRERNIVFHSFRHKVNTSLIEEGVPLQRVQDLIGHSDAAISAVYFKAQKGLEDILTAQETILHPRSQAGSKSSVSNGLKVVEQKAIVKVAGAEQGKT